MAVSFDSTVNDKVISLLNQSVESLNSNIRNKMLNDFAPFVQVNLFSTQLSTLKSALDNMEKDYESLKSSIQANKDQWSGVDEQVGNKITYIDRGSGYNNSGNSGGNSNTSSDYLSSNNIGNVGNYVSIKNNEVSDFVSNLDDDSVVALLKKIYKLKGKNDFMTLLTDSKASGVLLWILKRIMGDTTKDLSSEVTFDSEAIQKTLLSKINTDKVDVTTEEGKTELEKEVLEKVNDSSVDESKIDQVIYGDNTIKVSMLDGEWTVAKTTSNLKEYASYVINSGIRQNIDVNKYGDSCLSFSYSHAYDLFKGTRTNTASAGNYAHASNFEDFINDDKKTVLNRIYNEIMKGRPVVLQVNGNKQGTSRHFVTVVGFKSGVTASNLTEKDLLIMDSWDGKLERMDTSTSRFMTTGAACKKDYSGYRLRVLKSTVTA